MAPEHLKPAVVTLAIISLTLIALVATEWFSRSADMDRGAEARSGWRGALILFTVSLLVLGSLWGLTAAFAWQRDRVLWVGLGAFLAVMTITRPWWFWENYKARWLRDAIGDAPTAVLYLAFSAGLVWVGLFTTWTFGRR